jgi:hypothetical protein
VPQDVRAPVFAAHLEVAVVGREPPIEHIGHRHRPFDERELTGRFLAPVPGVALDGDAEGLGGH